MLLLPLGHQRDRAQVFPLFNSARTYASVTKWVETLNQPSQVAETVLKAIEKGRSEVTVPWFPYRPASVLQALAPGLVGRFAGMTGHRPGSV